MNRLADTEHPVYDGPNQEGKCIVAGCTNKRGEGSFKDNICLPCYNILITGRPNPTNSILKILMCKTDTNYKSISDPAAIWYGPHACNRCGNPIIKQAAEQGGCELDAPFEIRYPNHVYTEHECSIPAVQEKLPSRFQIGDPVSINIGVWRIAGDSLKVEEVIFSKEKVFYKVGSLHSVYDNVPSDDIYPA